MSLYVADVGEVIIKPEFREDFGHFFRREYDMIGSDPLKKFVRRLMSRSSFDQLFKMSEWSHKNYLPQWEGCFETGYDKEYGEFVYGIKYYSGPWEFFTELLPEITAKVFEKESVRHDKTHSMMNNTYNDTYHSEVGRIIIKPEYREDFDLFFHGQYSLLQTEPFIAFVEKHFSISLDFIEFHYWNHDCEKEEWRGKYETSYDEKTGRFVYGISYSGSHTLVTEFFNDVLDDITETVISEDGWAEPLE